MTEGDARTRIQLAAERLIAERGVEVPLRDIAVAAGQRNNSAVQYHFGSREQLITAIVKSRNEALEARRLQLLADAEGEVFDSSPAAVVRGLVEMLVGPMLETPYAQGATHYARFLEQVRTQPAIVGTTSPGGDQSPAVRMILSRLERAMPDVPPRLQRLRLTSLATVMFSLLADWERSEETGPREVAVRELTEANIVDTLVAILIAPPSAKALKAAAARRRTRSA